MDYSQNLLDKAQAEYPFIKQHDPIVTVGDGEGYAEAWEKGEEGSPTNPRPEHFPIDRHAVQIHRPGEFSHHDLAGEIMHVDPVSNTTRDTLMTTWTPKQLKTLEKHAKDWQTTLDEGRPVEHAIKNATDSAMRGYLVKQWPESINKELQYRPEQKQLLEGLGKYLKTQPKSNAIDKPLDGGSKLI